jgi:hypothetical protein
MTYASELLSATVFSRRLNLYLDWNRILGVGFRREGFSWFGRSGATAPAFMAYAAVSNPGSRIRL